MTDWRPTASVDACRRRNILIGRIRDYFESGDVLEVDTPALSRAAVSDPHIESLEVRSLLSSDPLYLHTSPEFAMKRLLAGGFPDIFSICRVFRDGEAGRHHQPEFTLLEWYRHGFGLDAIVADTTALIAAAFDRAVGVERHDYRNLVRQSIGIDPLTATSDQLAGTAGDDLRAAIGARRDDWLDYRFATDVASGFADDVLTVVQHYPASMAALARHCPADARVADRFEVYCGAVELANGYVELTDADEQRDRIAADQAVRTATGRAQRPVDESFVAALEAGLPPCAGVAVGIERLQMVADGCDDIAAVVTMTFGNG